jgi:mono/diheme cytochrome c family protein
VQALIAYISRIATVSGPVASVTPAPEATSASPGKALFFDAARGTRCSTCHEAEGAGLSIAPAIPKDATVATVRSKRVKRVRRFILASGESFPALVHSDDKGITKAFDLTTPPPVLRTFREGEIASWEEEREWSHAGATRGYTDAEIKAVLEYVTSAATRPPTK